ncbi:hypothetical protein GCM10009548_60350 [Streptomyces malaysiensis subsp. malaysiensis]
MRTLTVVCARPTSGDVEGRAVSTNGARLGVHIPGREAYGSGGTEVSWSRGAEFGAMEVCSPLDFSYTARRPGASDRRGAAA